MEDFTNQYISDTYQKVLHISDDGFLVDGTGSYVSIGISGSLTTQGYTTTQSFNSFTSSYYSDSASFEYRLLHQSPGLFHTCSYKDNNDGTLTIAENDAVLYTNGTFTGHLGEYHINGFTASFTDNSQNYVIVSYNSGSPEYQVTTDVEIIEESSIIPVITVYRMGNTLRLLTWDETAKALAMKLHHRIVKTRRFEREDGLVLAETGSPVPRTITVTAGRAWNGVNRTYLTAFNSSGSGLVQWAHSASIWSASFHSVYENNYYDNGTNLATLGNNRFATLWIYRCKAENSDTVSYVWSPYEYHSAAAAADAYVPTNLPKALEINGLLVGRIIIEKGQDTGQVTSAFSITYPDTSIINHNDTANLNTGDYLHLTSAEYADFTTISSSFTDTTASYAFNSVTASYVPSMSNYIIVVDTGSLILTQSFGNIYLLVTHSTEDCSLYLPSTNNNLAKFTIKKNNSSAYNVIIIPSSSNTIEFDSEGATIEFENTSVTLIANNTNWEAI